MSDFMRSGCGCMKWSGKPCCQQFTLEHVAEIRQGMMTLSSNELDLILMGQILANSNTSESVSTEHYNKETPRIKAYTIDYHQGKLICWNMFLLLHTIGVKRLKNLIKAVRLHSVTPRVHGNTRSLPKRTLSITSVQYIVQFLQNYVEQHGLLLPG